MADGTGVIDNFKGWVNMRLNFRWRVTFHAIATLEDWISHTLNIYLYSTRSQHQKNIWKHKNKTTMNTTTDDDDDSDENDNDKMMIKW